LELVVLFLHLFPFLVVPEHCRAPVDVPDDGDLGVTVGFPSQQLIPTLLLWILQ
jgi:hypothetical protein